MRHPDEGTLMAWVEGQLPADEAGAVAAHVPGCDACSAAVAEIRGLVARASGIVGALDAGAVNAGVVNAGAITPRATPAASPVNGTAAPKRSFTARRWLPALAAAAVVMVVMRQATRDEQRGAERSAAAPVAEMVATDSAVRTPVAPAVPQASVPARGMELPRSPESSASSALPKAAVPPARRLDEARTAETKAAAAAARAEPRAPTVAAAVPPSLVPVPVPAPAPVADVATRAQESAPDSARKFAGRGVAGGIAAGVAAGEAAAKAQRAMRMSSEREGVLRATIQPASRCYGVYSDVMRTIVLDSAGAARVGGQPAAASWREVGDSIAVRWGDTLLVFPAREEGVGRIGADVLVRVGPCRVPPDRP